jgi:hypothetical protein
MLSPRNHLYIQNFQLDYLGTEIKKKALKRRLRQIIQFNLGQRTFCKIPEPKLMAERSLRKVLK